MKFLRKAAWCAGLGAWAASAWAQVPPPPDVPPPAPSASAAAAVSVPEPAPAAPFDLAGSDTDTANTIQLASNIHAGLDTLSEGLPAQAVDFFQDALKQPNLDDATKDALNLDLTTAYLAQDLVAPAAAALKAVKADNTPAYLLRESLLSARTGNWADANAQIERVGYDNLSPADRPWYYGVQALIAEQIKDAATAATDWQRAEDLSPSPLQKAPFELARQRGQFLLNNVATPERAASLETSAKDSTITSIGAYYAHEAAIVLDSLSRQAQALGQPDQARDYHTQALDLVNTWLGLLPDSYHEDKNAMRLLFAMFNEEDPATANPEREQAVLQQVLQDHLDAAAPGQPSLVHSQELALFMLFRNAKTDSDRQALITILDGLLNPPPNHPLPEPVVLEQIYLLKAHLLFALRGLDIKNQDLAETAAKALVDKYRPAPGADRDHSYEDALRLLAYIAVQKAHFRDAADDLNQLNKSLPPGPESSELLKLVADLDFKAGDFSPAADLYASLLKDPAPPVSRGTLLWHAVLSELSVSPPATAAAIALLDQYGNRTDVGVNDRSMAEWNVLMSLSDNGHEADAFARLKTLLTPGAGNPAMPLNLNLRLQWMGARLAVQLAEPAVAVEQAAEYKNAIDLIPAQGTPEISPALRADLMASALLFCGEAAFRANLPDDEKGYFDKLRADYKTSEAAVDSLLFEADTLNARGQTGDAERIMKSLAENYPTSEYAPLAAFNSAVYADALGNPDDAISTLKDFISKYPDNPLVIEAQLLLGKCYLKTQQFDIALERYQDLREKIPADNPLLADAEMGEAYALMDLAAKNGDASSREKARGALERLMDLTSLPVDARIEAGFRLGKLLENGDAQGKNPDLAGAAKIYSIIQSQFLNDKMLAELKKTTSGTYWMDLCMTSLMEIYRQQGNIDAAQHIQALMAQYNFPSAAPASSGPAAAATTSAPATTAPTPAPSPPSPAPAGNTTGTPEAHTAN